MMLDQWAQQWGIAPGALSDLKRRLNLEPPEAPRDGEKPRTEADAQAQVQLEASRLGVRLWRNNVGAFQDETGRWIRYGLANTSKSVNSRIKSSDLVGIRPVIILPEHVGHVFGQLVAREIKRPGWKYRGAGREVAQCRFLTLVSAMGGDAQFATGPGTL